MLENEVLYCLCGGSLVVLAVLTQLLWARYVGYVSCRACIIYPVICSGEEYANL